MFLLPISNLLTVTGGVLTGDVTGDDEADTEADEAALVVRLLYRFGLEFSLLAAPAVPLELPFLAGDDDEGDVLASSAGIEARAADDGALLCGGGSAELLPPLLPPLPIMRLMRSKKPNESRLTLRALATVEGAAVDAAAAAAASPFTVFRGE